MTSKPWYKRVRRLSQTNLTEIDAQHANLEFWVRYWKEKRIDGIIINGSGIITYYQSDLEDQYPSPFLGDRDVYLAYSDAARQLGLAVIARMDINMREKELYLKFPQWFAKNKEGEPIERNGRYVTCINSEYYLSYVPSVLAEMIEKYSPDGFTDNSWQGLERNHICYCEACKTKFKADTHLALPKEPNWDDPSYLEWIRWGYQCRNDNWDRFNGLTQRMGGEDCLWVGMINGNPFNNVNRFTDIYAISKKSRIILNDQQQRSKLYGFGENTLCGNLLHNMAGDEVAILESMAHYYRGEVTFRLSSASNLELSAWMTAGIAGGISPWMHHIGATIKDMRQIDSTKALTRWHAENEPYLFERSNCASIGHIWSQDNIIYYGKDDYRNKTELPWAGFAIAMSKSSIPFTPLNINDLSRQRSRIKTLVLADIACMSAEQERDIVEFIRQGGNIVISGYSATLDEFGLPKSETLLWDELGIQLTDATYGDDRVPSKDWTDSSAHSYIMIDHSPIFKGFEDTSIMAFGGQIIMPIVNDNIMGVGGYITNLPIYPPEFSWVREQNDGIHPIYFGKSKYGGNVCYMAADLDRTAARYNLIDQYKLLSNLVRWTTNGNLPFEIYSEGEIQASLYEKEDCYVLHLQNLTGTDVSLGNYTYPAPLFDILIDFSHIQFTSHIVKVGAQEDTQLLNRQLKLKKLQLHEMIILCK